MARESRYTDASEGMDAGQYEGTGVGPGGELVGSTAPDAVTAAAPAPPPETGGSAPPPPSAGDESPDRSFPVPPVPPPPSPGPIFSLAGGGGGGAASFARPGTEAAKPFRSPIFTANRSTAMPRFGAGTPVTAGATAPFLPAGLGGEGQGAAPDDELQRILALMRGGSQG